MKEENQKINFTNEKDQQQEFKFLKFSGNSEETNLSIFNKASNLHNRWECLIRLCNGVMRGVQTMIEM